MNLLTKSVGYLTLNSSDPMDAPIFNPNYFAEPEDMLVVKEAMRVLKKIFDSEVNFKVDLLLEICYIVSSIARDGLFLFAALSF